MIMQPTPPPPPVGPVLSARDRASIADGIRQGHAIQVQAQREVQQVVDQTNRELAQGGPGGQPGAQSGASSVIKDANGRVVVTANGKTVIIDPKVGLDNDQVQEMVQGALQPPAARVDDGHDVQIVAIVFSFLLAAVWLITRTVRRRPVAAGPVTASLPPESAARLARIEQAVEAVAIEVERISEAQRYSAQLLTERLTAAPALAAAPLAAGVNTLDAPVARG